MYHSSAELKVCNSWEEAAVRNFKSLCNSPMVFFCFIQAVTTTTTPPVLRGF